jgi:two-component system NarL family response regulator
MAVIVAEPGPLRDSLQTLLLALPQVETVCLVGDASSAWRAIVEQVPTLVLLDTNLPGGEALALLKKIKAQEKRARCLVLADDRQQQQEATAAGADAALLKGHPAASLFETIEELLLGSERFDEGNEDPNKKANRTKSEYEWQMRW